MTLGRRDSGGSASSASSASDAADEDMDVMKLRGSRQGDRRWQTPAEVAGPRDADAGAGGGEAGAEGGGEGAEGGGEGAEGGGEGAEGGGEGAEDGGEGAEGGGEGAEDGGEGAAAVALSGPADAAAREAAGNGTFNRTPSGATSAGEVPTAPGTEEPEKPEEPEEPEEPGSPGSPGRAGVGGPALDGVAKRKRKRKSRRQRLRERRQRELIAGATSALAQAGAAAANAGGVDGAGAASAPPARAAAAATTPARAAAPASTPAQTPASSTVGGTPQSAVHGRPLSTPASTPAPSAPGSLLSKLTPPSAPLSQEQRPAVDYRVSSAARSMINLLQLPSRSVRFVPESDVGRDPMAVISSTFRRAPRYYAALAVDGQGDAGKFELEDLDVAEREMGFRGRVESASEEQDASDGSPERQEATDEDTDEGEKIARERDREREQEERENQAAAEANGARGPRPGADGSAAAGSPLAGASPRSAAEQWPWSRGDGSAPPPSTAPRASAAAAGSSGLAGPPPAWLSQLRRPPGQERRSVASRHGCIHCGRAGHTTWECPDKACKRCGLRFHSAGECPMRVPSPPASRPGPRGLPIGLACPLCGSDRCPGAVAPFSPAFAVLCTGPSPEEVARVRSVRTDRRGEAAPHPVRFEVPMASCYRCGRRGHYGEECLELGRNLANTDPMYRPNYSHRRRYDWDGFSHFRGDYW